MNDCILVKAYSKEYQDEVVDFILGIQQNEFAIPITKEDQPDLSDIPNYYQRRGGNFWLALYSGRVVGTLSLLDIGNHQAALRKMFVNPAYRGEGYNTAVLLLQRLLEHAREQNMREIYLGTTVKFLAAHRFYEKNKFVRITRQDLPEAFPIMKVDTIFYKYSL